MSKNGEIYTACKNFTLPPGLTGWTNFTSVWAFEHWTQWTLNTVNTVNAVNTVNTMNTVNTVIIVNIEQPLEQWRHQQPLSSNPRRLPLLIHSESHLENLYHTSQQMFWQKEQGTFFWKPFHWKCIPFFCNQSQAWVTRSSAVSTSTNHGEQISKFRSGNLKGVFFLCASFFPVQIANITTESVDQIR